MWLLKTKPCSRSDLELHLPKGLPIEIGEGRKLPIGFPLILDSSGKLNWGAFCFLLDLYRIDSTRDRTKTLQTYAESLTSWFKFLEREKLDWRCPAPWTMSEFRGAISNGVAGGRPNSNATVNLRTAVVKEFYAFLLIWKPADIEGVPIQRFLASLQRLRPAKGYQKRPRPLTRAEVSAIAKELTPVHSLIFRWTIATGMRRSTTVGLALSQLPRRVNELNYIEVRVKGGKLIEVPVTASLMHATMEYLESLRPIYLSRSGLTTDQIFVDARGRPASARGYYQAFRRAVSALGIQASPHCARHTFAVHMKSALDRLAKSGAPVNPGKVLQHILGHSSARTTEIYLGSVSAVDAGVLRALIEVGEMAS